MSLENAYSQLTMVPTTPDVVFTRYLYLKSFVIYSLECCISEGKTEEALFWGYELYFSGFRKEAFQIAMQIYAARYIRECVPGLGKFLEKKKREWEENEETHWNFGSLILNLSRHLYFQVNQKIKHKFLYIIFTETCMAPYITVSSIEGLRSWKFLRNVCKYSVKSVEGVYPASLDEVFRTRWLYYASFSPIWKDRILQFDGVVREAHSDVIFMNEDKYEMFCDNFHYEPDEQPLCIRQKCIGVL